jgi:drug/metabolite transporter (DMT)-like permease
MRSPNIALSPPASSLAFRIPLPVLVAAFCLLWSSAFSVAKIAVTDCPPLLVLTARFLLAAAFMLGVAAICGVPLKLNRRDALIFALLGIANQAAYLGLSYVGIRSISSGLAALVISANPVLTAVLAAVFLNDRITWRKVLGLLLGIAGVAFVVNSRVAGGAEHPVGIAFTAASLVSLVGGTILFKKFAPTGGLWVGNGVQSLSAGLATLPFAFTFESTADIVPSWRLVASLAYLALFVSVFAYLLWFHLLNVSGATAASAYHFMMPPLGMLFGWLLLGEHVAVTDLVGIAPVAIGIYLVTQRSECDGQVGRARAGCRKESSKSKQDMAALGRFGWRLVRRPLFRA